MCQRLHFGRCVLKLRRITFGILLFCFFMPLLAVPSLKLFLEDKATSRVLSLIDAASLSGIERLSDEYIIELARVYHKKYLEKER